MKTFKQLVSEIYEPKSRDEKNFVGDHVIKHFDYPVKNKDGLPFRDDSIKPPGPQHKKPATYDPPDEPTKVYKKANEEVEVTEASKHIFHVQLKDIDLRSHKMVDDNTSEPMGSKSKSGKLVMKVPATNSKEARDKVSRHIAKNFGVSNVKSIEYKGLEEEVEEIEEAMWDKESLLGIQKRHAESIMSLPKNAKYSTYGHLVDKEYEARKKLKDRHNITVEKPNHPLVTEEVEEIDEKKLTPAEMKKREEIAKAMAKENPNMPMGKKMAIATSVAKRVAEESEKSKSSGFDYPMTYEKGVWGSTHKLGHATLRFDNMDSPTTPERVRFIVKSHPKHKEILKQGWDIKQYGEHTPVSVPKLTKKEIEKLD